MKAVALFVNFGACIAAIYFGYVGYPWYWMPVFGAVSAAVSVENLNPTEQPSFGAWVVAWLMAALMFTALLLALYLVGAWIG